MNIVIGILALLVGAVFCFSGISAMRVVISIWGAFFGLSLGAGVVAATTGKGYLDSPEGWIVGLVVAAVFALIAYLYYAVSVVLAMASIGFVLGTALMMLFGVDWNWVIIGVGVIVGVLLAWLTISLNLPALLLVVLSALGGATVIVAGLMLLTGVLHTSDVGDGSVTARIHESGWWWLLYAVLAIAGIAAQYRKAGRRDLSQDW
ncbi:MAG: DUF4203 domain-containing protein [Gordonia sp. (in: high G+C Gram-positive bacteria)]|uniref:TM7S3/TM198-like domain-containing protein n=1 Tax=Gordonia sp. (in: high G+C Gram-positive bacteria) TaxID=84139 RepID=UPI0039E66085